MSSGFFKNKIHHFPIRIYYEDTDTADVVYHANYIKFAERGRTEFLRHCGIEQYTLHQKDHFFFAAYKMDIQFLAPAHLDDEVIIETKLTEIKPAKLIMQQCIKRDQQLLTQLTITIACIDDKNRPTRLPQHIASRLYPYVINEEHK